jgi:hypothetical protein
MKSLTCRDFGGFELRGSKYSPGLAFRLSSPVKHPVPELDLPNVEHMTEEVMRLSTSAKFSGAANRKNLQTRNHF